jgi:hypothetical protein
LASFNLALGAAEQPVTLSNVDTFTYFLIQEPGCPEFFEYAGSNYDNGVLSITLNHFILDGGLCPAGPIEYLGGGLQFDVFRAQKS